VTAARRRRDAVDRRGGGRPGAVEPAPLGARAPVDDTASVAVEQVRDPVVDARRRVAAPQHLSPLVHPHAQLFLAHEPLQPVERRLLPLPAAQTGSGNVVRKRLGHVVAERRHRVVVVAAGGGGALVVVVVVVVVVNYDDL